jgi:hypothetical protein
MNIEGEHLAEGGAVLPADLPKPSEPGAHVEAGEVPSLEGLDLLVETGAWTD